MTSINIPREWLEKLIKISKEPKNPTSGDILNQICDIYEHVESISNLLDTPNDKKE